MTNASGTQSSSRSGTDAQDHLFAKQLVAIGPQLRVYAYSLAGAMHFEDLAQEAMARAWKARRSFQPGTNFRAWLFRILRNQFITDARRRWRTESLDPCDAEALLATNDNMLPREYLVDVRNAMQLIPPVQRETLMLSGLAGLSHGELAQRSDCATGTIKSRLSRARTKLVEVLAKQETSHRLNSGMRPDQVLEELATTLVQSNSVS